MNIIESALLKKQKSKDGSDPGSEDVQSVRKSEQIEEQREVYKESRRKRITAKDKIAQMKQARSYSEEELNEIGLISKESRDTKLVNEYRNLRTKLLSTCEKPNFITLVTSVTPECNTSLITANIAATFALDEAKTALYINGDASCIQANELFDIEDEEGLVDLIESDDFPVDSVIYETPINRLRYIPLGKNHEGSAEHFSDEKMKNTMASIVNRYPERFIFINAPSIASSADTRILLDVCDKVILVVPYGTASEDSVKQSVLSIGQEKLAGILLYEF